MPRESAQIPADDPAILFGWGLFETTRAYRGVAFHLESHVARMRRSLRPMRVTAPRFPRSLGSMISKLLRREGTPDNVAVRLTVTKGPEWDRPHWMVTTRPVPRPAGGEARLIFAPWSRSTDHPLHGHKTLNYLEHALARELAKTRGAFEAVYVSTDGWVLEGTASNVFLVRRGRLVTPALGQRILPGITRQLVLSFARRLHLFAVEALVRPRDLLDAEQVFITNSLVEVVPASHLDGRPLHRRRLELVRRLQQCYREEVERYVGMWPAR